MQAHRNDKTPRLDALLGLIPTLEAGDLGRVREAVGRRKRELDQSSILERRAHGVGLLQLEYRANPKTGTRRGPYWYYHYREYGKQRTLYVGVTDDPESAVVEKLAGRRIGRERRGITLASGKRKS